MTKASGSFILTGVFAFLIPVLAPSPGRAEVVLATATAPRFANGAVKCSAVNVGDSALDITVSLIDVSTGTVEETTTCTGDGSSSNAPSVPAGERCVADSGADAGSIVFCKITVDLVGGSGTTTPNPALALLRQQVRGNIIAISSDSNSFAIQQAE